MKHRCRTLRVIEPATPAAAGVIYIHAAAAAAVTHLATLAGVRLDRAHPFGCAQIFIAHSMHALLFVEGKSVFVEPSTTVGIFVRTHYLRRYIWN